MLNEGGIITQVNKLWKRSFRDGVVIPDNEDLQTKTFNARCNALKRDLPDENYIMKPYNGKHNINEIIERIKHDTGMIEEDSRREIFSFDIDYYVVD